jgi:hypothetical protein
VVGVAAAVSEERESADNPASCRTAALPLIEGALLLARASGGCAEIPAPHRDGCAPALACRPATDAVDCRAARGHARPWRSLQVVVAGTATQAAHFALVVSESALAAAAGLRARGFPARVGLWGLLCASCALVDCVSMRLRASLCGRASRMASGPITRHWHGFWL